MSGTEKCMDVRNDRGNALYNTGRFEEAKECYEAALAESNTQYLKFYAVINISWCLIATANKIF